MKIRYIIPILLLIAFIVNSCDKVNPPFVESRDYCSGNKKVLIEDYTGHGCPNCPDAAVTAHTLKEQFCDRIVIVTVHAGYFATPYFDDDTIFAADFTTEAGNTWDTFFGNSLKGNPNGLVDRTVFNDSYVIFPQSWGEVADKLLLEPAEATVVLNNDFDNSNNTLTTTVNTEFLNDMPGAYKVIVCITQDNIISPQENNNHEIGDVPIDSNYVHNHVLRASLNGSWGENVSSTGNVAMGVKYEHTYTKQFPEAWKPEDCHVVAFVYDEETKQVLQVEELAVLEE